METRGKCRMAASAVVVTRERGQVSRGRRVVAVLRKCSSAKASCPDVETRALWLRAKRAREPAGTQRRRSQSVERAANAERTLVQHVQVHHRRTDIRMAEQLLHGANVVAVFQQRDPARA